MDARLLPAGRVAEIARDLYGLRGAIEVLESEHDQAIRSRTPDGRDCIVKLGNAVRPAVCVELQVAALEHLAGSEVAGLVPRVVPTRAGEAYAVARGPYGTTHIVHALEALPGAPLGAREAPPALRRDVGRACGRLDHALRGFFHPAVGRRIAWDVRRASAIADETGSIPDAATRRRVCDVLNRVSRETLPVLARLSSQVIHHDVNRANVMVDDDATRVRAVVDFGDVSHAPRVAELAVAAASLARGEDPLAAVVDVAVGYDEVLALEAEEVAVLPDLVLARLASAVAIGAARPTGAALTVGRRTAASAARALATLDVVGVEGMRYALRAALRLPPEPGLAGARTTDALLAQRQRVLGAQLSLAYPAAPLWTTRGEGVWLIDRAGRRHLDAYNNVPHVGHCHPHVVRAVARQTACLATNARYLYEGIVDYAERLATLAGDGLDACWLVNSGSEANDLAWQMAVKATGRRGAVVAEHAYHGITERTRALSQRSDADPRNPSVARFPVSGASGARDVEQALAQLHDAGHEPAALVLDCAFTSNGLPTVPDGYVAELCASVRSRDGVVIADEVQTGLGRVGPELWGYRAHGIVPDLVVLGKAVGNGFPLGVVIGRKDLVDGLRAFSTFGGNPVACAAGMATLDVLERDDLAARAAETGAILRQRLAALADGRPCIGDVRGRGLLIGVELIDPRSGAPDPDLTRRVMHGMRAEGVLIGRTGPGRNVLKIRPPLAFIPQHADILLSAFDRVLAHYTETEA